MIGEKLLHYEILEKIGAGGMGVVYRARDEKLRRDVALKLLPPELVRDPDKLARFEREARVLASLNHPHIAAIHGLERDGDRTFLVLELVPGQDLGRLLAGGPLPLEQALALGRQIAEGLETAHDQGVIHRDLKPQNIMITPEGTAKILDFGLAKALESDPQDMGLTAMPTVTSARTNPGVIMGTAAYMSPEQARGTAVDRRTDIWAFGCVLFEMLSGQRVFGGETVSDVLASVLKTDPEWEKLPGDLPPALRRLLRRCFTRDARQRLRDIGEARIRLEAMIAGDWGEEPAADPVPTGMSRGRAAALVIAAGLVLGVAGLYLGRGLQPETAETPVRRFVLAMTDQEGGRRNEPVISRDGRRVVYEQDGRIWIHELDQLEPRVLEGPVRAEAPFWSPDGTEVAFFESGQLWRMPVEGGRKQLVCHLGGEVLGGRGGDWLEDGTILFSRGNSGIFRAAAVGGDPHLVIAVNDSTEGDLHEPRGLPDGSILFVVHPQNAPPGRLVIEKDGVRKVLLDFPDRRIWSPRWDPRGYIIYERDGATNRGVWVLPFDLATASATGEPVLLVPEGGGGSTSESGLLVYIQSPLLGGEEQAVWVDRTGAVVEPITGVVNGAGAPQLSPDEQQLALSINEQSDVDIWIQDLRRGTRLRLPHPDVWDIGSRWAPEGDRIYFHAMQPLRAVYARTLDATAPLDSIAQGGFPSLGPDGRYLVYEDYTAGGSRLAVIDLEADPAERTPRPVFTGSDNYFAPALSPDGRWLAYGSDESGGNEVYVRTFPGGARPQRVSLEGGTESIWGADGRTLFFTNDAALFEVTTEPDPDHPERLQLGRPVKLFDLRDTGYLVERGFDVADDGERFVMIALASETQNTAGIEIVAVENWLQLLEAE